MSLLHVQFCDYNAYKMSYAGNVITDVALQQFFMFGVNTATGGFLVKIITAYASHISVSICIIAVMSQYPYVSLLS